MIKFKFILALICSLPILASTQSSKVEGQIKNEETGQYSLEIKGNISHDVYIDGKKYDSDILKLLDQNQLESINVVKGQKAIDEYNAPNGVILIISKRNNDVQNIKIHIDEPVKITMDESISGDKINFQVNTRKDPLFIIDGEIQGNDSIKKLAPGDIDHIEIIKGEAAMKKYNAPQGVVIVTTMKDKKKKIRHDDDGGLEKILKELESRKDPLFIVDGNIWGNDSMKQLDPEDIDRIRVLKDEAAKTKYNAPDGVIIITTKKKKGNKKE